MRTRHKPPSLVSMWMLDVFCCALGCVTLLWLLNTREASDNAARAGSALESLARSESELKDRQAELIATKAEFDQTRRKLNADIEDLQGRLLAMTQEQDATAKRLALAQGDLASARDQITAAQSRSQELDDLLMKKQQEAARLTTRLATATQSADDLMKLLRQREQERDDIAMKAQTTETQLSELDARLRAMTRSAQDAEKNLAAMRKSGDELAAAQAQIRDLTRKTDEANAMIIDLQGQKARLADKYDKLQIESESRFAGIALTGRRAVFVVDISGSMKLLDDRISAPDKWAGVVDTIARVMRSLPGLEQYQVVTFSRRADYLFGGGEWQSYQGESSVQRVTEALRRVDPVGDTNLYDGLDLAFRLRASGLDTVYLFSDGLPTSGPGLQPGEEKTLSDVAKSEKMARHIRQTLTMIWNRPGNGARVRVNSVGFFFESPEVGAFLWALSRENDGSFVGMSRP